MAERKKSLNLPEENLLYFLEKNSLVLEPWQREVIRIVRVIAQYFYPQRQTQVMNEGCATFVHYTLMNTLFDRGRISEGAMLEILRNHSNVVFQPAFDDPRFSGINPYALGLDMMQDIQRISTEPTAEFLKSGRYEINVSGSRFAARIHLRAPYDPERKRILT